MSLCQGGQQGKICCAGYAGPVNDAAAKSLWETSTGSHCSACASDGSCTECSGGYTLVGGECPHPNAKGTKSVDEVCDTSDKCYSGYCRILTYKTSKCYECPASQHDFILSRFHGRCETKTGLLRMVENGDSCTSTSACEDGSCEVCKAERSAAPFLLKPKV